MEENNKEQKTEVQNTESKASQNPGASSEQKQSTDNREQKGGFRRRRSPAGQGGRRGRKPIARSKPEFAEQVVDLRRVVRVMGGGKRFRFRATLIIGDKKGRVGVGMGKGADVQQAIEKAKNRAKKALIKVEMDKGTIPHEVTAKYSAAKVIIKPAKEGNGLVAGGPVRVVLSLAGVKDATAKCLGRTSNKVTNALATIEALKQLKPAKNRKQDVGNRNQDKTENKTKEEAILKS
ncbi:MAG: 30S ribosomal protein S5 [bacterium]|nr:30S ribosomal protein S5 [bacterium]